MKSGVLIKNLKFRDEDGIIRNYSSGDKIDYIIEGNNIISAKFSDGFQRTISKSLIKESMSLTISKIKNIHNVLNSTINEAVVDKKYNALKDYLDYLSSTNDDTEFNIMLQSCKSIDDIMQYFGYGPGFNLLNVKFEMQEARSEYDANRDLDIRAQANKGNKPSTKPKYKIVNSSGRTVHSGLESEKHALDKWKDIPNNTGHKIVKEDLDPSAEKFYEKAATMMIKKHLTKTKKFDDLKLYKDSNIDNLINSQCELIGRLKHKLKELS